MENKEPLLEQLTKGTSGNKARLLMVEAAKLVCGQRQDDYGDYVDNVTMIARNTGCSVMDVCNVLVALKETRLSHSPCHLDSSIDLIAYTALREVARRHLQEKYNE